MNPFARVVLALACWSAAMVGSAQDAFVVYGDESYPPYSYMDPGTKKAAGIYVEILQMAFAKMPEYKVDIQVTPWKRALSLVETGDGMAVFPPYYNQERAAWMNFSEPILDETIVVYGKEEKLKGKAKWPEDFYGSTVGINFGFVPGNLGGKAFADAIKAGKITLDDGGKSNESCLSKIELGRLDFYLNDRLIDIRSAPSVRRSSVVASTNQGYLGFTKKTAKFPQLPAFKAKFDGVIKDLKKSGAIAAVLKKHMGQ